MKTETSRVLLLVACVGLLVAGAIFLCLTMFGGGGDQWTLPAALGCVVLSGLFGLVYSRLAGKHDEGERE